MSGATPSTPAGHRDVHDDHDVQEHRAGLVDADDRERLAADLERVADLLGAPLGVGEVAGDLLADDDVGLALVLGAEDTAPLLPLQQGPGIDGALQSGVGDDVLPLDHRRVEDSLDGLAAGGPGRASG